MRLAWLIPILLAVPSLGQLPDPKEKKEDPIPPEVALEAIAEAYSARPVADEVTIKFRSPGSGERTDTFVIRLQPGPTPRSGPTRMFLDLGALKIYGEGGKATAINANVAGKYVQAEYSGPLKPSSLAGFLPPIPLPQLAFACGETAALRAPTPYTPDITWTLVTADLSTRPPTATISGSGPSGVVSLVTNAETGRIMRLSATIHGRSGDSILDLTSRPIDPGDPAAWAFRIEGRERVPSIASLRPTPMKRDVSGLVPDLQCTRPDSQLWSLSTELAAGHGPLMVLLFHAPDGGDDTGERDARAGLESLEIVGHMGAGVPPGFRAVAGVVFDPRPDSMDRWRTLRKAWERPHPPGPFIASGELFWAPGGSAFIDRFLPGAKAAIVIVNPDRTLRGAVSLDGRAQRPEGLDKELRALLEAAPAPSNPPNKDAAPEAPR